MPYVPMTASEFREGLAAIKLSQLAFARLLNVAPRTVRTWALAERPIPPYAATILRLMVAKKISVKEFQHATMTPIKPS
jgi:DNA-binding transcriptional regulator YiaG